MSKFTPNTTPLEFDLAHCPRKITRKMMVEQITIPTTSATLGLVRNHHFHPALSILYENQVLLLIQVVHLAEQTRIFTPE